MADNETIADIIAEKRRQADEIERDVAEKMKRNAMISDRYARELVADIRREANRLEAAIKRERAKIEADALEVGGIVEAARRRELSKNVSQNGADFGQLGNAAKLREACANIAEYARSAQCHTEDAHVLGYLNQIEGWAKAALAAPARNCDKYATADEALKAQEQMFNDSNFANGECKLGCPECDNPRVGCKIAWRFAPRRRRKEARSDIRSHSL